MPAACIFRLRTMYYRPSNYGFLLHGRLAIDPLSTRRLINDRLIRYGVEAHAVKTLTMFSKSCALQLKAPQDRTEGNPSEADTGSEKREWEILQTMQNRSGEEKYIHQNASDGGRKNAVNVPNVTLYISTSSA